jgi:hypothetical protein
MLMMLCCFRLLPPADLAVQTLGAAGAPLRVKGSEL